MKPSDPRQRGFAVFVTLLVMVIVAAALAALTAAVSDDAHRTMHLARQAQLEQMLFAAVEDAQLRIASTAPQEGQTWTIELPDPLMDQSGTLTAAVRSFSADGQTVVLNLMATLDRRRASQLVRFQKSGNSWRLVEATYDAT